MLAVLVQPAGVVHGHALAAHGFCAIAHHGVFHLYLGRSLGTQQFHFKHQSGVGRNHATSAVGTVAQFWGDDQGALAAHLHALYAFVPAWNHHAFAQREFKRLTAVFAGVKLCALLTVLVQPAGVVHLDVRAAGSFSALSNNRVFELQARGSGDQCHENSLYREMLEKQKAPSVQIRGAFYVCRSGPSA